MMGSWPFLSGNLLIFNLKLLAQSFKFYEKFKEKISILSVKWDVFDIIIISKRYGFYG